MLVAEATQTAHNEKILTRMRSNDKYTHVLVHAHKHSHPLLVHNTIGTYSLTCICLTVYM